MLPATSLVFSLNRLAGAGGSVIRGRAHGLRSQAVPIDGVAALSDLR